MKTDGGGWTQCLRAAWVKSAAALYTKTYSKVYPNGAAGSWYDFCPQLTGADYILSVAKADHTTLSALKFTDSKPSTSSGEWNTQGIKARKVDVIAGGLDVQCGSGGGDFSTA